MTAPTPADLDAAVLDAMRALAVARQSDPQAVEECRQALLDARAARGYGA